MGVTISVGAAHASAMAVSSEVKTTICLDGGVFVSLPSLVVTPFFSMGNTSMSAVPTNRLYREVGTAVA